MWPGPYGEWGSRKYLLGQPRPVAAPAWAWSTSTSSTPTGSTRTPRSRRRWARSTRAVRQGKALYVGISSYSPEHTARAAAILRDLGTPLLIHQPSYSMLNRWIEDGLLDVLGREGVGCIAFSPLAQGMLTDRYLDGIPADSRAAPGDSLSTRHAHRGELGARSAALDAIAARPRPVAGPAGAGLDAARPADDLRADRREQRRAAGAEPRRARRPDFTDDELAEIDRTPVRATSTCGRRRSSR